MLTNNNQAVEEWRKMLPPHDFLEVSNIGNVRYVWNQKNITQYDQQGYKMILLPRATKRDGNTKAKRTLVHRLVGTYFIPNPENKPHINHKNGVRGDNRVENLEWCTHMENIQHAYRSGLANPAKGANHYRSIRIMNTQTGDVYESLTVATKRLGVCRLTINKILKEEQGHLKVINPS
jgi:hypothetical protein